MRPRLDGPSEPIPAPIGPVPESPGDNRAVTELLVAVFRRDLATLIPHAPFEPIGRVTGGSDAPGFPFRLIEGSGGEPIEVELLGARYDLRPHGGPPLSPKDGRLIRAIGAVQGLRFQQLFRASGPTRLELYRGGTEDHYVAAYIDPTAYEPRSPRASRIASTIQTLRTAALSTYENHRVSTGALLVGPGYRSDPPTSADALPYSVELTGLKSIHRLCDGERTLFLVDEAGRLSGIVDIARWAALLPASDAPIVPCARSFEPHALATRLGGHVCVVLSPNQEIKLFAEGSQAFAFAHGRWRVLDPAARFAKWVEEVADPALALALFRAALNVAEARRGGLFVVARDPDAAFSRLISPFDRLDAAPPTTPPEITARDPLAKRALHYLARGRSASTLDPPVLEALASLDGALVTDASGRLLAFGSILRHDPSDLPGLSIAEGARTTAALSASRFGPVLKVSEDGIVSCFLDGARAWDL